MAIDPQYMIASSLQEYFVDKETGLPLSGGILSFYKDTNRTQPKTVYMLSGSPPSYTYTELPNPLELSAVGTPNYAGNDIVIYYYPFDADGNIELYYVTVTSAAPDYVPQFTREAWPNFSQLSNPSSGQELINYVPNPQFVAHNNLPADDMASPAISAGQITQAITEIAQGGWTFERPAGSNAIDFVTFFRYGSFVDDPTQAPRYAVQTNTTSPDITDAYKNLCINFADVNKFTNNPSPTVINQVYTLYFEAQTVASADFDVVVQAIKNFGSGGSSPITLTFDTVTITNAVAAYTVVLDFGENSAQTIGSNNDDFVQVVLSLPTGRSFNGLFTNFLLTINNETIEGFPTTTDRDMLARSLVAPAPDPDGYDLYLPLILTKDGLGYDHGVVGEVTATAYGTLPTARLWCDGASYLTSGYSDDGIPYRRLFDVIQTASIDQVPAFGTGHQFVTMLAMQPGDGSNQILSTNQGGVQTSTQDGAVPTGFTFGVVAPGQPPYGFKGYCNGNLSVSGLPIFSVKNDTAGVVTGTNSAGTSGFSMTVYRKGQPLTTQILQFTISAMPAAGTYFRLATTTTQYYVWFRIDGVGSDPAPGGTGIRVDLLSTYSIDNLCIILAQALTASRVSSILPIAGSLITPNSYFTFHANSLLYVVWMSLNGTGTRPTVPGAIYIEVPYSTSNPANEIGAIIENTINTFYFATPDLRGVFVRGLDTGSGFDPDVLTRYALNYVNVGPRVGSMQFDDISDHDHSQDYNFAPPTVSKPTLSSQNDGSTVTSTYSIGDTGGSESRPINMALNYVIRY